MANNNCSACEDLRQDAPSLIVNGIDDTMVTSLMNNTGLNPSSGNKDCEDLNNMNDCLVGNMESEVELYEVCDWKTFMKSFIPNVWTTLKGIISAVCGLWTKVERHECILDNITATQSFAVGEDNIKWFNGVTINDDDNPELARPRLSGNAYCGYMTGSIVFPSNFATNFPSASISTHGILLYEYRIKLSDFNLRRIYPGNLQEAVNGSGIHAHVHVFYSNSSTNPYGTGDTGYASYTVPDGWAYLQIRVSSYDAMPASGKATLCGVLPVLMNPSSFSC